LDISEYPDAGTIGVNLDGEARFFRLADALQHPGNES
jgi:hypothetical protein